MTTQDRLPTGQLFGNQFTPFGETTEWEAIDDAIGTPDDDTTYIFKQNAAGTSNQFTFTAFAIDSSSIAKIIITAHSRTITGDTAEIRNQIHVNGTAYVGSFQSQTDAYVTYTEEWLTNPDTGLAWVEADVEGTGANPLEEFSLRAAQLQSGEELRVTQGYITVDFTEAAGEDPAAESILFSQGQQQPRFDPPEVIGY